MNCFIVTFKKSSKLVLTRSRNFLGQNYYHAGLFSEDPIYYEGKIEFTEVKDGTWICVISLKDIEMVLNHLVKCDIVDFSLRYSAV